MIYDRRPDYCDLQLSLERKETVEILQVDEEGKTFKTTVATYDGWAAEFFQFMGLSYDLKGFYKRYYQAHDGSLVWAREGDKKKKASLQFKGSFFLRADWQEQLEKAISFFRTRGISLHPSRWDVGILFMVKDERAFYRLIVDKKRWPAMRCHYQFETEQEEGFLAKHSRLEVAFYNKHRQVRDVKSDTAYKERLLAILRVSELPENLMKCDIRIRQKDQTRAITKLLLDERIDFAAIERVVLQKCGKKTQMGRTLRKILGLSQTRPKILHLQGKEDK